MTTLSMKQHAEKLADDAFAMNLGFFAEMTDMDAARSVEAFDEYAIQVGFDGDVMVSEGDLHEVPVLRAHFQSFLDYLTYLVADEQPFAVIAPRGFRSEFA